MLPTCYRAKGALSVYRDLVIWSNGEIRLAKASDNAYEEVARIKILDAEGDSCTIPSYANGHFYVRNFSKIAAVKVSK